MVGADMTVKDTFEYLYSLADDKPISIHFIKEL